MNNRVVLGGIGAVAAVGILLAVVQSLNLNQSQTQLAAAYNTATVQASSFADQATDAANLLTAAAVEAGATRQAAATSAAGALNRAEADAATAQAQALASAEAQAAATLRDRVALAATDQAGAVADAEQTAAAELQAALAGAKAQATGTLGAVIAAGETAQVETAQAAATDRAQAVASVEAYTTATLGAVVEAAALRQATLEAALTGVQDQLATVQSIPTATPQPTLAVPRTITEWCAEAVPAASPTNRTFREAEQVLLPQTDYVAILCTGAGAVYVDLFENLTPVTVNNFVFLAQAGYYNNTNFHRVIENFMAQGGDPTGSGTGGPGYAFGDEIVPSLRFDAPGRLAMANAGPNTNGSQFFITFGPQAHLDGSYTIFGQVVEGQAHVRAIARRDPAVEPNTPGTTLDTVLIITDPTMIKLTEKIPPTRDEVVKAMTAVDSLITADLAGLMENRTLNQTSAQVVEAAPTSIQVDLGTFFDIYHHRYRVGSTINNLTCDTSQIQFYSVSYTLDAFATEADAAAAIVDPVLDVMALKSGFDVQRKSDRLPHAYFLATESRCDEPVIHAMTYWRRGSFIITAEIILPAAMEDTATVLDTALLDFVGGQIYEPLLTDILYSSID